MRDFKFFTGSESDISNYVEWQLDWGDGFKPTYVNDKLYKHTDTGWELVDHAALVSLIRDADGCPIHNSKKLVNVTETKIKGALKILKMTLNRASELPSEEK